MANDVDLFLIPGDHYTVFSEPGVSLMAKCIRTGMRSDVGDAVCCGAANARLEMAVQS
jgi:hypothetical protein